MQRGSRLRIAVNAFGYGHVSWIGILAPRVLFEIEEGQARSMAVARSVTSLENDIATLAKQIKTVSEQDPDSRLYQRAAEMLQAGASMDEVMHSCDLPAAEVQLLMNIHKPA